jgi:hypothetical protein
VLGEAIARNLSRGCEERKRDREVEARAFFLQLGRREVDSRLVARPLELRRLDPATDPLLRLLARAVDEADDREGRNAALDVRFHLDATRLEADEGKGDRAREHGSTVRVIV